MPLTRILVATDHSATAQRAEEFAGTLAGPGYRLEITLLSVHPELPRPVGRSGVEEVYVAGPALSASERAELRALLAAAAQRIRAAAGAYDLALTEAMVGASDVGRAIVHQAEQVGAEAIVLGSRGRSDLSSLVLGSVSHKVLHLAHCPVILVRRAEPGTCRAIPSRHVPDPSRPSRPFSAQVLTLPAVNPGLAEPHAAGNLRLAQQPMKQWVLLNNARWRPPGPAGRAPAQARPYAALHDPTWHQVPVGLVEEHLLPVVEAARARRLRRVVVVEHELAGLAAARLQEAHHLAVVHLTVRFAEQLGRDAVRHHFRLEVRRGAALGDRQVGGVAEGVDVGVGFALQRLSVGSGPALGVAQPRVDDHRRSAVRWHQHQQVVLARGAFQRRDLLGLGIDRLGVEEQLGFDPSLLKHRRNEVGYALDGEDAVDRREVGNLALLTQPALT